ncbi:MAG: hypothetical protein ACOYLR_12855 [Chlorobium sp.]
MAATVIGHQLITDVKGNPVGVILPLPEFALVEETLRQLSSVRGTEEKLAQMEQAANDILFMDDLRHAISDFADTPFWQDSGLTNRELEKVSAIERFCFYFQMCHRTLIVALWQPGLRRTNGTSLSADTQ